MFLENCRYIKQIELASSLVVLEDKALSYLRASSALFPSVSLLFYVGLSYDCISYLFSCNSGYLVDAFFLCS